MTIGLTLLSVAGSFLLLFCIFTPLEKMFPRRSEQKFFRPEWWTDLFFFLGQYLVWTSLVFIAIAWLGTKILNLTPWGFHQIIHSQPFWLQLVEVVLLSDLLIYWGHRMQHKIPILWRFHSIHQSTEHLDWLAAHREHPLDTIYTVTLVNLPAFLLGFPLETLAGLVAFRGLWAVFIHSNVKIPLGPLRMLFGGPERHHWHHHKSRDAGNYANLCPIMDLVFGTYRHPKDDPAELGIHEPIPRSYWGQLIYPFRVKNKD